MNETRPAPNYVCRCEEIGAQEVRDAIAEGARSVNDVKRRTRAGMGVCQGIYCVGPIADLIAAETGLSLGEIVPMTARPPVRLVPLGLLAEMEE
ncbi:MAG: (2Fe-2S)-binding protein [Thermomicrobiales bacterium]